jgi:hypothetical protein
MLASSLLLFAHALTKGSPGTPRRLLDMFLRQQLPTNVAALGLSSMHTGERTG